MRLLPYGRAAVLVELDDARDVPSVAAALLDGPGVLETVPGARTVLVRVCPGQLDDVRAMLPGLVGDAVRRPAADTAAVTLDVVYDGADLVGAAERAGMSTDALVRAHAAAEYVVAFCGFAPGFAYLSGLDPTLHLPRLDEPRTRVPAGSVAVAGEFTGVYPRASPGGWRLLGHTDAELWDLHADPPALLAPGTRVRFRARR